MSADAADENLRLICGICNALRHRCFTQRKLRRDRLHSWKVSLEFVPGCGLFAAGRKPIGRLTALPGWNYYRSSEFGVRSMVQERVVWQPTPSRQGGCPFWEPAVADLPVYTLFALHFSL
jgi:hypothetical protein